MLGQFTTCRMGGRWSEEYGVTRVKVLGAALLSPASVCITTSGHYSSFSKAASSHERTVNRCLNEALSITYVSMFFPIPRLKSKGK